MKRDVQPFGTSVVRLRLLTEADLDMTLGWRNRDDVRVWFKNTQLIAPDRHYTWFSQYAVRDDDFVFVVEYQGRPVGLAAVYGINPIESMAEIGRFVVAADARGQGYITLACAELLRFCAESLNLKSVFLEVKENNERAIRIYSRNGFHEESRSGGLLRMSCSLSRAASLQHAKQAPVGE